MFSVKCCSYFKLGTKESQNDQFPQKISITTVFNNNNKKREANQHITEGSCGAEDWSNAAGKSALQ